jgi:hypothetical protein
MPGSVASGTPCICLLKYTASYIRQLQILENIKIYLIILSFTHMLQKYFSCKLIIAWNKALPV